jgi:hypothetical protein
VKEIFIASSNEALEKAERVAAILADVDGVKPRLWKDEFKSGDITFVRIEELAREVAGAVVIATPDDRSVIRDQEAQTPRANVLFEYGFLVASLGRARVALCRYEPAMLPSDLSGLTHIPMGRWPAAGPIDARTTLKIKDWARGLPRASLGGLTQEIAHYETRLRELKHEYKDVLDGKVEHSRRNISFQLDILEEKLADDRKSGSPSDIRILGINATGPLHQGREILIRLLQEGGRLQLLLLDPSARVFEQRCDHENDRVGRIGAELYASICILMDIISQVKPLEGFRASSVELRLHAVAPDRSLLMMDCDREDGIVMENPYPPLKGKRGVEGQMYPLVQRGRTARGYVENARHYKELWEKARTVALAERTSRHKIAEWPFRTP